MAEIRHRIGISAPQASVYEALATKDGLSRWWTHRVEGDAAVGGTLNFFFSRPEPGAVMDVLASTPGDRVSWRCVGGGADEWIDTRIDFELKSSEDDQTVVLFTHRDWQEPSEFMAHCSTKWGYHLLGLKAMLEDGQGTPYPEDIKVSNWG